MARFENEATLAADLAVAAGGASVTDELVSTADKRGLVLLGRTNVEVTLDLEAQDPATLAWLAWRTLTIPADGTMARIVIDGRVAAFRGTFRNAGGAPAAVSLHGAAY
jgi:hypothetical protein